MQIGAPAATAAYSISATQAPAQAALAAVESRQPTNAPVETQAAVRPQARAEGNRSAVEDYKRDERPIAANDPRPEPKANGGRGQLVDIRA